MAARTRAQRTDAERQRPIPASMQPSDAGLATGERITARAANLLLSSIDQLSELPHPIERAVGATRMLDALKSVIDELKDMRRDAVKDAYEAGSSESGWYGYSALAQQLGISPSRVRQILYDITTDSSGAPLVRDEDPVAIREVAGARREAIRLLRRAQTPAAVAQATGLSLAEVKRIAAELAAG